MSRLVTRYPVLLQFDQRKPTRSTDTVGPFQLGIVQPSTQKVKKWSELSTGGKVLRTTARTTNFSVILIGAGLSAVLVYALASELFAKNSPTVLYGDACERIKASPLINGHLRAPLTFHNNPPLMHRPRHRNRHVNFFQARDSSGREHLLLNFYVQGSDPTISPATSDSESFVNHILDWTTSTLSSLSNLTFDQALQWSRATVSDALQSSKRAFAYLIGEPLPPLPQAPLPRRESEANRQTQQDSLWSLSGIFTRLTGKPRSGRLGRHEATNRVLWSTGEAHADFVKDASGTFVYRYLLIDIPDSNSRNPTRLFVERIDGVHENEAVVGWASN
ncbi:TIM21-domain-containing protein [Gautieria morchelliformis]|nr:TIM21-domain-containing protein [Gautieria morchelliformis]